MRAALSLLTLITIACPLGASAERATQLGQQLAAKDFYLSNAKFEVLLPQAEDPVTYDLTLQSEYAAGDTLAPCDYAISWSTTTPSGILQGFSAYFNGNHYRFRNNRLQEYHFADNPTAFLPKGPGSQEYGVQCSAQFADMLPQFIGKRLIEMDTDTNYIYTYHPDTLVHGQRCIVIDGVKRAAGYDSQRFIYVFDKDTSMPISADFENSPGSLSEQLVTLTYMADAQATPITLTEDGLISAWPDAFEKFRESTFRTENLIGQAMPTFSCQILGQEERYAHHTAEPFANPTVIAVLDPEVSTSAEIIEEVRQAIQMLPMTVDVLWALNTNSAAQAEALMEKAYEGETILMSAGSLVRNAGISMFPTIIMCRANGQIIDVRTGYNKDIGEFVIQKMAIGQ